MRVSKSKRQQTAWQPGAARGRGVDSSEIYVLFFTSADKILNRHALKRLSYVSNSRTIFVLQKNGEPWRMWSQYSSAWVNLTQARPSLGQVDPGSEGQGYTDLTPKLLNKKSLFHGACRVSVLAKKSPLFLSGGRDTGQQQGGGVARFLVLGSASHQPGFTSAYVQRSNTRKGNS